MAFSHGSRATVWLNGESITAYLDSITLKSGNLVEYETKAKGGGIYTSPYVPGYKLTLGGLFDPTFLQDLDEAKTKVSTLQVYQGRRDSGQPPIVDATALLPEQWDYTTVFNTEDLVTISITFILGAGCVAKKEAEAS